MTHCPHLRPPCWPNAKSSAYVIYFVYDNLLCTKKSLSAHAFDRHLSERNTFSTPEPTFHRVSGFQKRRALGNSTLPILDPRAHVSPRQRVSKTKGSGKLCVAVAKIWLYGLHCACSHKMEESVYCRKLLKTYTNSSLKP